MTEALTAYCPTCREDIPVTTEAPPYSIHHVSADEHHEMKDCPHGD